MGGYTLGIFGLDAVEELVYLALLDRASATRAELCRSHQQIAPGQIGAALRSLEDGGLVARRAHSRSRYVAVPPDLALLDWLRRQTSALQEAQATIGALSDRYHAAPRRTDPFALIEVVRGRAASRRWNTAHAGARRQVRAFEHPPFEPTPTVGAWGTPNPIELHHLAKGVAHRVLYDQEAIQARSNLEELRDGIEAGEEARVTGELPMRMMLIDDAFGMFPLHDGGLIADGLLIVHPCAMLAALSALFETIWRTAPPLLDWMTRKDERQIPSAPPDESLAVIAGLLAAGLSDQAIARHLGISARTLARHIQRLMTVLGAKTRYQAGMLAARRGWI